MTLMFENTSENKSLSLRYGNGLNLAIQLLPGEKKPIPVEFTKGLLQSYLSLFKDLKVIEEVKGKKNEAVKKSSEENNTPRQNVQNLSEQSNALENGADTGSGSTEENNKSDSESNKGELDNENKSSENTSNNIQEGSEKDQTGGSNGTLDNSDKTENATGQVPEEQYTAKQLKALHIDQIKEIAIKLGIDVEAPETNSKKELIAVILNKQGNK